MSTSSESGSSLKKFLREPTVQFGLAAAALFAVARVFGGSGNVIEISGDELEWRILQAEVAQGGPLSEEARGVVEAAYIDEQVLVREALAMGLEDDERIHDILAQKMLHVLSGDVIQPTEAELEGHYRSNLERYTPEPTVSVDEVVVSPDASDPVALPAALTEGTAPGDLVGAELLVHRIMPTLTGEDLTQLFSPEFAVEVMSAELGSWVGPHLSVRGAHWIRVNEGTDSGPLPLDAVRERVRLDWIAVQEEARLTQMVSELRGRYKIRIVEGGP